MKRKKLRLEDVRFVVLDEADEMLNMGFIEDVELIVSQCNEERRMLLFSATMPARILSLAERYMGEYDLVRFVFHPDEIIFPHITSGPDFVVGRTLYGGI